MAKKQKPKKIATKAELKRLIAQSEGLQGLTTLSTIKTLSPKRYDKLLVQLKKVDRAIAKITKIVS